MKPILQDILAMLMLSLPFFVHAQNDQTGIYRITSIPSGFFKQVNHKMESLDRDLDRKTDKYLEQLINREKKLQRRLYKVDSNAAKQLFAQNPTTVYNQYLQKLKSEGNTAEAATMGGYLPYADSLKGSLEFLNQHANLISSSKESAELQQSLAEIRQLQNKFQSTDQIKQYIQQRREEFKEALKRYINNSSLKKYLDEYNKTAYYYSEQVREYKDAFNDPEKLLQKVLVILDKIPAFADFMKKNSQLAALFNVSGDYGSAAGLDGLQTRAQVQQLLQGTIGSSGGAGMAALESNLQAAHDQLDNFKEKLNQLGGGSGDMTMPDFKPNNQKTHSFLKRLEVGTNLQTTRADYFFPTTTDFGLSVGYKINDKSTVGIGGSYNVGWGQNFNHIHVTSNGASLRSFVDVKIRKNIYFSGGYELNYQKAFTSFNQISSVSDWSRSGLLGLTKMVSLPGKVVKKTKVQFFWDFLSYYQVPRTQPIKFRIGYNF